MFYYIYWNPKKEIFTIPGINFSILWYSVLFLIGFLIGYYIFIKLLKRYFSVFPSLTSQDIIDFSTLKKDLEKPKNQKQKQFIKVHLHKYIKNKSEILISLNNFINNNMKNRIFLENIFSDSIISTKKKIVKYTDKLLVYIIIATVVGARLGHLIFYENPEYYLKNPLNIIKVWQGGLASHGAAIALLLAIFLFIKSTKNITPKLSYIHLLDFVVISVAFAGFCIRIGNFFNQEIVGIQTNMPWAVIFANPMENVSSLPRHPVQLYEAFFYLMVFFLLFYLSHRKYFLVKEGKLLAIFLTTVFCFRFLIEFLKVKESHLLQDGTFLLMGQYLSLPFIVIGIIFLFWDKIKSFFLKNNKIID